MAYHGAVLADSLVPTHRTQPHPQLDGLHHRGRGRVPECERDHPAGERHAARDPRRVGLEHLHGRQVAPVPDHRDERRLDAAELALWPRVRALVWIPRRRDQPVVPGPGLRQSSRRPAEVTARGLPPHRRPHRQGAGIHQGREGARAGQAVLPVLRAGCGPRPAPCPRRTGSPSSRAGSTWATKRCASRPWPGKNSWASSRPTPSCRRSTRSARQKLARARRASRSRRWMSPRRGSRCQRRRSACSAGWPRCTRDSWRTPTITSAGCWTTWRSPGSARTP